MLISVLLLAAFIGQSAPPSPLTSARPSGPWPTGIATLKPTIVFVDAQPPAGRTIKAVFLKPNLKDSSVTDPKAAPVTPYELEALPNDGVRATFHRPRTGFWVVITLDDGSVHGDPDKPRPQPYTVEPYKVERPGQLTAPARVW
jgi:hypothetical protein